MWVVLLVLPLIVVFAVLGERMGRKGEEPLLAAGNTEYNLRVRLTPSELGGMLGILPYLAFVVWLIVEAMMIPPEEPAEAGGGESAATASASSEGGE